MMCILINWSFWVLTINTLHPKPLWAEANMLNSTITRTSVVKILMLRHKGGHRSSPYHHLAPVSLLNRLTCAADYQSTPSCVCRLCFLTAVSREFCCGTREKMSADNLATADHNIWSQVRSVLIRLALQQRHTSNECITTMSPQQLLHTCSSSKCLGKTWKCHLCPFASFFPPFILA